MNIFSDIAIDELSHYGIYPFSVLHMKEKFLKQPIKPVIVSFPVTEELQGDEKLLLFQGDNETVIDVTEISKIEIGEDYISFQLHQCYGWNML